MSVRDRYRRLFWAFTVALLLTLGSGARIVRAQGCEEYMCLWYWSPNSYSCIGEGQTIEDGNWRARCECWDGGQCFFFPY